MSEIEKEALKKEISQDLTKSYFKFTLPHLITLLGCTVTICCSIFGGVLYLERVLNYHLNLINDNSKNISINLNSINQLKSVQVDLWREDDNLQGQINILYKTLR